MGRKNTIPSIHRLARAVCDRLHAQIQIATMIVWAMRKVGVPKKRANRSALTPNQSLPKTESRCECGK